MLGNSLNDHARDALQQQAQAQMQYGVGHNHSAHAFGSIAGGMTSGTATTATDSYTYHNTGVVGGWEPEVETPKKKRLDWYRVNDKMSSLGSKDEPLDDLRVELREEGLAGLHLASLNFEIGMNADGVIQGTHRDLLI